MLVKYVSIDGIPQAFLSFRFVDIIVIIVHDRFWNVAHYRRSTDPKRNTPSKNVVVLQKQTNSQWAKPVSLTCHSVLRKLYAEPSIDASYHGHFVQAKRFQFFSSKLSNQKQDFHMAAMFLNKSRRDEKYL
jgi:hypothetical protein